MPANQVFRTVLIRSSQRLAAQVFRTVPVRSSQRLAAQVLALWPVCSLISGCVTSTESSTAYSGSASAHAIAIGGYTTEPGGEVIAQVQSSLWTGAKDPATTWKSIGAFFASTSGTTSGNDTYYPWTGTLQNFTDATWPAGGVARVRMLYEVDGSWTTGTTFDDLGCLLSPGADFATIAVNCAGHDSGYLHLVDGDPVTRSSIRYISLRETAVVRFGGSIVSDPAKDYYATVDPTSTRTTLAAWQAVNGFAASGSALPGYQPSIQATYFNKGDLELGRRMYCTTKISGGDAACYVTNYGDPAAARGPGPQDNQAAALAAAVAKDQAGLVATVAMEYRPNDATNRVTFFAYNATGTRVTSVELDREGSKNLPGACLSCHGGRYNTTTRSVAGAHFLPFDVDNLAYSTTVGYRLADQQAAFRALNDLVVKTGPTVGISELVAGWYGGNTGATGPSQNNQFVPAGWSNQAVLYEEVIKPYCRSCHLALDVVDFNTASELEAFQATVLDRVCERYDMPHAQVTRDNFWASPARGHLIGEFNWPTPCD